MRIIKYCVVFFVLNTMACKKDPSLVKQYTSTKTASSSFKYSIGAKLIVDNDTISEINIGYDSLSNAIIIDSTGQDNFELLESGKELWFKYYANKGDILNVSWQDSWWPQYTVGSIYVTAFESNKSTEYFSESRLIQMDGSPRPLSVGNSGDVYLKVRGYDNNISGTFSVRIDKLNVTSAKQMQCDTIYLDTVAAGGLKFYKFNVQKDSTYTFSIEGSQFIGAHGDEVSVKVSALRENLNANYFYEEQALSPVLSGTPNLKTFIALNDETVYVCAIGAYWWYPRDIKLKIVK